MSKYRTQRTTVPAEHTVGGQTLTINVPARVQRVVHPVDLDALGSALLTAITLVVVTGAMAWSTVAIGTLLHRMAPAWVSYLVAIVFDLTWVACMVAEWLLRYDGRRVWVPRCAGFAALAVSVLTIVLEGYLTTHSPVIGVAGATISVLAKGLWTVTMMVSTRRLSERDQLWYAEASSEAAAQLAMTAIQRKLVRTRARADRERLALGMLPDPAPVPVQSGSAPASVPVQSGSGFGPVIDRVWVRIRNGMDPVADRNGIVADILAEDPSADPETVRRMIRTARNALASQAAANP
jgi:hypothetical protein